VRASPSVICIGAGPAGLTAAYLLAKRGVPVTVIERDPVHVGGIARTVQHEGFRFDIGGHRFFSKSAAVEALWSEILGPDLLERPRKSRVYYRGKLFAYPLPPAFATRRRRYDPPLARIRRRGG
jgi:protoporphyrinogen oxidase